MPKFSPGGFQDDSFEHCPFLKHKGKIWEDVVEEDPSYIEWILFDEKAPRISDELYEKLTMLFEER